MRDPCAAPGLLGIGCTCSRIGRCLVHIEGITIDNKIVTRVVIVLIVVL